MTDIVERLRAGPVAGDPVFEEAADEIGLLREDVARMDKVIRLNNDEIERLRKKATALQERITEDAEAAVAAQREVRNEALQEALQIVVDCFAPSQGENMHPDAVEALRLIKELKR